MELYFIKMKLHGVLSSQRERVGRWREREGKKEYMYFTHTLKNNFGGTYRGPW